MWNKHKYHLELNGWTIAKTFHGAEIKYSLYDKGNRIEGVFSSSADAIKHYELLQDK